MSEPADLLNRAWHLIRITDYAVRKLGLKDHGADLRLPHEVRMLALAFSDKEEPRTPEHTILSGSGEALDLLKEIKAELERMAKERGP